MPVEGWINAYSCNIFALYAEIEDRIVLHSAGTSARTKLENPTRGKCLIIPKKVYLVNPQLLVNIILLNIS